MMIRNNIENILKEKGFYKIKPTEDILKKSDTTPERWYLLRKNKANINVKELFAFAEWLEVDPKNLVEID